MTVSEFAFLAMGLVLGVAAGAALVEVLRARPPAPHEVRVTVAQDAIPRRRSSTLSDDWFASVVPEPARGGPADRRDSDDPMPTGTVDRRTPVRSGWPSRNVSADVAAAVVGERSHPRTLIASSPVRAGRDRMGAAPGDTRIGVPVGGGADPMIAALRASATTAAAVTTHDPAMSAANRERVASLVSAAARSAPSAPTASAASEVDRRAATAARVATAGVRSSDRSLSRDGAAEAKGIRMSGQADEEASVDRASVDASAPCADQRRIAAERCELADRARAGSIAAEDVLRTAQRAYEDHEARAEAAARIADPRAVRMAKDVAQAAFRHGRTVAVTTDAVESAARAWLDEINRINGEARDAASAATRDREAARVLALDMERLVLDADAARISAENAGVACLEAREAVAACDEQASGAAGANQPVVPSGAPIGLFSDEESPLGVLASGGTPRIFRLLRGDRTAMGELVIALAGNDPAERRRWQLLLSDLIDAIVADSIGACALEFPPDHPFWGPFTLEQDRDIAKALSSLGYRFDGLGGWVDARVPSQRDLSLAVGYAGLDPMRIRRWPTDSEMGELVREVAVAADEHLAAAAGDLLLGELVSMLGRRADGLAEVWNHWGRIRPLLLEER